MARGNNSNENVYNGIAFILVLVCEERRNTSKSLKIMDYENQFKNQKKSKKVSHVDLKKKLI